jgi:hypothetical protein
VRSCFLNEATTAHVRRQPTKCYIVISLAPTESTLVAINLSMLVSGRHSVQYRAGPDPTAYEQCRYCRHVSSPTYKSVPTNFGISSHQRQTLRRSLPSQLPPPASCEDSKVLLLPHPMFHPSLCWDTLLFITTTEPHPDVVPVQQVAPS